MNAINVDNIYQDAINQWGEASQLDMVTEELAELIVAVCHLKRDRHFRQLGAVIEEIADVEIMLGQLKIMLTNASIPGDIDRINNWITKVKHEKINRLAKRLYETQENIE